MTSITRRSLMAGDDLDRCGGRGLHASLATRRTPPNKEEPAGFTNPVWDSDCPTR